MANHLRSSTKLKSLSMTEAQVGGDCRDAVHGFAGRDMLDQMQPALARVHDYVLGGATGSARERELAEKVLAIIPGIDVSHGRIERFSDARSSTWPLPGSTRRTRWATRPWPRVHAAPHRRSAMTNHDSAFLLGAHVMRQIDLRGTVHDHAVQTGPGGRTGAAFG
jgi:hypothetical protein